DPALAGERAPDPAALQVEARHDVRADALVAAPEGGVDELAVARGRGRRRVEVVVPAVVLLPVGLRHRGVDPPFELDLLLDLPLERGVALRGRTVDAERGVQVPGK